MIGYYNYTVILTYLGLAASLTGIFLLLSGAAPFSLLIYLLLFAGFCDMFDGRIARTMKRNSMQENFGVQIDSLSDLICFGVYPACIVYKLGLGRLYLIPILVLFVLFGLIRLGFFNVRAIEKKYNPDADIDNCFIGLPITCSSLLVPLLYVFQPYFTMLTKQPNSQAYSLFLAVTMLLCAIAFISPFRIRKPGKKGMLVLVILGLMILAAVILSTVLRHKL